MEHLPCLIRLNKDDVIVLGSGNLVISQKILATNLHMLLNPHFRESGLQLQQQQ